MTDESKRLLALLKERKNNPVKLDLEAKLQDTIATLQAEIGANDATDSKSLNGITNTSNSTINSSPATYIKSLARTLKTNHRADIRDIRLILRALAKPDTDA